MSKKSRLRGCFDKKNGKRAQKRFKSASRDLYHPHWSLQSQFSWWKSLLLACQILGLLINTLAANENHPVLNRDNLKIPIQMQLSRKQTLFFPFSAALLKSSWNFERFEKKNDPHSFFISETTYSENVIR